MGPASAAYAGRAAQHGLSAYALAVVLAAAPSVAVFSPLAMALLFTLAVLAALPALRQGGPLHWPPKSVLLPLAGVHLWQAISLLWCLDLAQAARSTAAMTSLTLGGAVLFAVTGAFQAAQARLVARAALWGLLLGGVVFLAELNWGTDIRQMLTGGHYGNSLFPQRLNRAATIMALLALPVGLLLLRQKRWVLLAVVVACIGAAVTLSSSTTAKICFLLGPAVAALAWRWGKTVAAGLQAVVAVLVISMPFVINILPDTQAIWDAVPRIPSSAHHRITIWKFVSSRVMEKPVFGWGMDASRDIPGGEDQVRVVPPPGRGPPHHEQQLPLHPHNSALQWWLELGGLGVTLGLAAVLGLISAISRLDRFSRALGLGLVVQGVAVASISFGAWQSWWLGTVWLLTALVLVQIRQDADRDCQTTGACS